MAIFRISEVAGLPGLEPGVVADAVIKSTNIVVEMPAVPWSSR